MVEEVPFSQDYMNLAFGKCFRLIFFCIYRLFNNIDDSRKRICFQTIEITSQPEYLKQFLHLLIGRFTEEDCLFFLLLLLPYSIP